MDHEFTLKIMQLVIDFIADERNADSNVTLGSHIVHVMGRDAGITVRDGLRELVTTTTANVYLMTVWRILLGELEEIL